MNHFGSKWRLDYGSPRRLVKKICCSKWISQFNGLIKPQGTLFSLSNGLCRCICVLRCRRRLRLSSIITVNLPTTGRAKKKKKTDLVLLFQYGPTADHWKGVTTELFPFSLRGWFPPFRVQTAMVTIWQCIFLYDDTQMRLVCTVVQLRRQPYSNFLFLFFIFCRCSQIISGRRQCLYFWKLVCQFFML